MTDKIDTADFRYTLYAVTEHVVTITLNRPERRNALNLRAYGELEWAFRAAQDDPDVRCVIVTATDPAFCSGDDLVELQTGDGPPPGVEMTPTPAAMAALECDLPIIAAINGAAVGWGMEIALLADIRIASERAKFAELFIKRGLVCDVAGLLRLPAIVGPAKAAELLFTGEMINAQEALRIGLVSDVVPHGELLAHAQSLAARIAVNPPLALRAMKEGLKKTSYGDPYEVGRWAIAKVFELMRTADHKEGVASFIEKRAPVFVGR